jgi:hypothetical protein
MRTFYVKFELFFTDFNENKIVSTNFNNNPKNLSEILQAGDLLFLGTDGLREGLS